MGVLERWAFSRDWLKGTTGADGALVRPDALRCCRGLAPSTRRLLHPISRRPASPGWGRWTWRIPPFPGRRPPALGVWESWEFSRGWLKGTTGADGTLVRPYELRCCRGSAPARPSTRRLLHPISRRPASPRWGWWTWRIPPFPGRRPPALGVWESWEFSWDWLKGTIGADGTLVRPYELRCCRGSAPARPSTRRLLHPISRQPASPAAQHRMNSQLSQTPKAGGRLPGNGGGRYTGRQGIAASSSDQSVAGIPRCPTPNELPALQNSQGRRPSPRKRRRPVQRTTRNNHPRKTQSARQPVSRVLSTSCEAVRPFLWDASHDAPHATNPDGGAGMPLRSASRLTPAAAPIRSCSRWGLPYRPCCQRRGALLPHRFALPRGAFQPCSGGLISVALSLGSPPPAVSRHRIPVEPGLSSRPTCVGPAVARLSGG